MGPQEAGSDVAGAEDRVGAAGTAFPILHTTAASSTPYHYCGGTAAAQQCGVQKICTFALAHTAAALVQVDESTSARLLLTVIAIVLRRPK